MSYHLNIFVYIDLLPPLLAGIWIPKWNCAKTDLSFLYIFNSKYLSRSLSCLNSLCNLSLGLSQTFSFHVLVSKSLSCCPSTFMLHTGIEKLSNINSISNILNIFSASAHQLSLLSANSDRNTCFVNQLFLIFINLFQNLIIFNHRLLLLFSQPNSPSKPNDDAYLCTARNTLCALYCTLSMLLNDLNPQIPDNLKLCYVITVQCLKGLITYIWVIFIFMYNRT